MPGKADDGVERRAQFMAHGGDEHGFQAVQLLQARIRLGQFTGPLCHFLFELVMSKPERGFRAFAFGDVMRHPDQLRADAMCIEDRRDRDFGGLFSGGVDGNFLPLNRPILLNGFFVFLQHQRGGLFRNDLVNLLADYLMFLQSGRFQESPVDRDEPEDIIRFHADNENDIVDAVIDQRKLSFPCPQLLFGLSAFLLLRNDQPGLGADYRKQDPSEKYQADDQDQPVSEGSKGGKDLVLGRRHDDRPETVGDVDRHVYGIFLHRRNGLITDLIEGIGGSPLDGPAACPSSWRLS